MAYFDETDLESIGYKEVLKRALSGTDGMEGSEYRREIDAWLSFKESETKALREGLPRLRIY